ncbi:FadR/GntR family transcriptional regulator [Undibacterium sp. Tian12W]|uniref:FadR/GntR family transcriptional regulator n=1 Tax=Undibacterium sp. Tian12W TaxID=3413054 RepID=UPI003BEFF9B0
METQDYANALPTKRRHKSLSQGLVESISNNIKNGILKPGEKLPTESAIMNLYDVSRTVVREAISHLQAAGLVQTRHGIGTFILEPSQAASTGMLREAIVTVRDVLDILELRISLETEAAWLAASRRTEEQAVALGKALEDILANKTEENASVNADVRFHLLIAQSTGNRYFVDILSNLGTTIIPRARLKSAMLTLESSTGNTNQNSNSGSSYLERVNREHEDIYLAIQRKDPEAARAAMRTHLSNSRERLRQAQQRIEAPAS